MGNKEVGGNSGEQAGAGANKFDTLSDMPPFNPDAAKAAQAEASADDGLNGWGSVMEHSDQTINDKDQANRLAAQRNESGFRQVLAQEAERAAAEREANARFEAEFAQALKQEESEKKHAENLAAAEANQEALRGMSIGDLRKTNMAGARQEIERRAAEMPKDENGDLTMETFRAMRDATAAEAPSAEAVAEAPDAVAVPERGADGSYDWKDPAVFDYFMKNDPKVIRDEMPYGNQALRNAMEYGTTDMTISPDAQAEPAAWTESEQKHFDNMVAAEANQEALRGMSIGDLRKSNMPGARQELERRATEMPKDEQRDLTMETVRALKAVKEKKEAEEAAANAETAEAEDTREMWERALDDPDYMTALANKSTKAIEKILGTKQHPRDALEKLLMRAYGAVGEGDANTQKRDREKLAKIGANYEAYLKTLNDGAEALAEVVAAENPVMDEITAPTEELAPAAVAESNERMQDLRSELMGKLGEHADLLDDEEGTIRNLNALDEAGLQALLDKVNAKIAAKGAETPKGDFFTPTGIIFEGVPVPGANLPETPSMESVTEPIEATFIPPAPIESVEENVESNTDAVAENNTEAIETTETVDPALVAEAERVSPGLFERIKAAFKEPGFLKRVFNKISIRKAVNGWLANRRANAAEANIAAAPAIESAEIDDSAVRNNFINELMGANGVPGTISGNEAFFDGRQVPTQEELRSMSLSNLQNLVNDLRTYRTLKGDSRSGAGTNVSGVASAGEASA